MPLQRHLVKARAWLLLAGAPLYQLWILARSAKPMRRLMYLLPQALAPRAAAVLVIAL
jgi:hypothetical protein